MTKAEGAGPRKPQGRLWCEQMLMADVALAVYGLKNLKVLHAWLEKTIAWAEHQKRGGK